MTEKLDVEALLSEAVRHFWITRRAQTSRQGAASGVFDTGNRRAVTAGKHADGFGTPFDLATLASKSAVLGGLVDLQNIQYVKFVRRFFLGDQYGWPGLGFSFNTRSSLRPIILDRMVVTVAPVQRLGLHRQLLEEQMGDVALMPLYWDLDPILMLKGVRGVATPGGSMNLANVFDWDKE